MDHAQVSGSILYGPRQVRASGLEQWRTDSNCVRAYLIFSRPEVS